MNFASSGPATAFLSFNLSMTASTDGLNFARNCARFCSSGERFLVASASLAPSIAKLPLAGLGGGAVPPTPPAPPPPPEPPPPERRVLPPTFPPRPVLLLSPDFVTTTVSETALLAKGGRERLASNCKFENGSSLRPYAVSRFTPSGTSTGTSI